MPFSAHNDQAARQGEPRDRLERRPPRHSTRIAICATIVPCASCREGKPRRLLPVVGNPGEIYPVQIGVVGRYAISIQWSDGHDTGIYSYETLRQLCPCEQCQPATAGETTT